MTRRVCVCLHALKDAIESTINILNLEPSSGATSNISDQQQQQQQRKTSKVEFGGNNEEEDGESKDNGPSDSEDNKYPAEWNFSMSIPESSYRTPIEIPSEDIGRGSNRCVYFVCHSLNDNEWIELPSTTPHQINVSRRITKYLTGNLDAEISSYPCFPGTEREYLRSLIARISAGCHLAPKNFYKIGTLNGDENEDDEDEEAEDVCSKFSLLNSKEVFRVCISMKWKKKLCH